MKAKFNPTILDCFTKVDTIPRARAEVYEGMPAIRKSLKPDGSYQQLTHLETGKLIALEEGNYKLIEKNGEIIEETQKDPIFDGEFSIYKVVKGKDGKIKSLSENTGYPNGTLTLTEYANGYILSETIRPWVEILRAPNNLAKDVDAINAVKRYNGETETSAEALHSEARNAILSGFLGRKPKF